MPQDYLIYDVGSTYTKAAAFRFEGHNLDCLGRSQRLTTLDDIGEGLAGCRLALAERVQFKAETATLASSSAAGGLRMAAMGYMPKVTAKAAKEVAMNSGARVLEVISHNDPPDYRLEALREIRPDIILLAGGTDGGEAASLAENAAIVVQAGLTAKVVLAGNIAAQPEAGRVLEEGQVEYVRVGNVMPNIHELNVAPARAAIHAEFIRQIIRAPGLAKLAALISDGQVTPTPAAILLGAELLARGTHRQDGVGGVLVLDIGGATTDVHSVIPALALLKPEDRGLVVSNDRQASFRTVEGNIGLRVNAAGLVNAVGPAGVLAAGDRLRGQAGESSQSARERVANYAAYLEACPGHLPADEWEGKMEEALAVSALETALKRHAGYWVSRPDPVLGLAPGAPVGRDLRGVKWVIGVGGIFSHRSSEAGLKILREALARPEYSLWPESPEFRLDLRYLLYAVGLLGRVQPEAALNFAKRYFEME